MADLPTAQRPLCRKCGREVDSTYLRVYGTPYHPACYERPPLPDHTALARELAEALEAMLDTMNYVHYELPEDCPKCLAGASADAALAKARAAGLIP